MRNGATTAGTTVASGPTLPSDVPDDVEVLELERRVFCSAGTVASETDSVMGEVLAAEGSKLAWVVGRRMRKLLPLVVVGEDMFVAKRSADV